ncbi:Conserved_hypothetical protein [Hexamita inflata]|uniref:Transmembrane protein n=1 Tax=Hexamita inflata TaxID=28002 RepID=A0ABP1K3C2_9EUKA
MSYETCKQISECSKFICSLFPSCNAKSKYNSILLDVFAILFFIIAACNVVIFVLYISMKQKINTTIQFLKISVVTSVALLCRAFWCLFYKYAYSSDSAVQVLQILNATALTLIYLQQSFYIQSWLQVILVLNSMRGKTLVKWLFPVIDSILCLICVILITIRCLTHNNHLYIIFTQFTACMSLSLSILFIITGSIIFSKLKSQYRFCSKTVQSFTSIAFVFVILTVMRFLAMMWQFFYQKMEQNTFGILEYFVPDAVSSFVVNGMQLGIYLQINRKFKYDGLVEEGSQAYTL